MKRKAVVTGICAIMICALAAAAADFALTGRVSPARRSGTCCMTDRSTVHRGTGATWISASAQQPKHQWQWADAIVRAKSAAPRQIWAPFLEQLARGLVGSLTNPHRRGTAPYPNVWEEGGFACHFHMPPQVASEVIPGTHRTVGQFCGESVRVPGHHRNRGRHRNRRQHRRPPSHRRETPPRPLRRRVHRDH